MKKVAIIQSSYIPWKGYFDIIHDSDVFVFLDDVQFTNRDWRSRNKIKTAQGPKWLTVPVGSNRDKLIQEVVIPSADWQKVHWDNIKQFYQKAPFFAQYKAIFEEIYLGKKWETLSGFNQEVTKKIAKDILGISTIFVDSQELQTSGSKQAKLIEIVKKVGGDVYISGPSARDYIDPQDFIQAQIELVYKEYTGYPEYPQFFPPFEHAVTILDLIFNVGPEAAYYIWGWRETK